MDATVGTTALLSAAMALAMGLVKVIEILLQKVLNGKEKQGNSTYPFNGHSQRIEGKLDQLVAWHDTKDQDGVPLGYFPRRIIDVQKEMTEALREIAETNKRTVEHLGRISARFDDLEEEVSRTNSSR